MPESQDAFEETALQGYPVKAEAIQEASCPRTRSLACLLPLGGGTPACIPAGVWQHLTLLTGPWGPGTNTSVPSWMVLLMQTLHFIEESSLFYSLNFDCLLSYGDTLIS